MRKSTLVLAAVLALSAPWAGHAQEVEPRARFDAELARVYDYLPTEVSQDVRDAKVADMDAFWDLVKSDIGAFRPLLREALADPNANGWFLFDAAGLLDEVAEDDADRQRAADAIGRAPIDEASNSGWFRFTHHLGVAGADIISATLQMLGDADFAVSLPQHAMTLRQEPCMRLCLLTQDEAVWVPRLLARFAATDDDAQRVTLITCLSFAVTPDADALVARLAEDESVSRRVRNRASLMALRAKRARAPEGTPTTTREAFSAMLAAGIEAGRVPYDDASQAVQADALHHVRAADVTTLRSLRRRIARRVSDESLGEIDVVTEWLRAARARGD